jgi:hypothetical protein
MSTAGKTQKSKTLMDSRVMVDTVFDMMEKNQEELERRQLIKLYLNDFFHDCPRYLLERIFVRRTSEVSKWVVGARCTGIHPSNNMCSHILNMFIPNPPSRQRFLLWEEFGKMEDSVEKASMAAIGLWETAHHMKKGYENVPSVWRRELTWINEWIDKCPDIRPLGNARTTYREALECLSHFILK